MFAKNDLIGALKQVGLCPGDIVFFQVSLDLLDLTSPGALSEESCSCILGAMRDVIGPAGTILMPSFSLSFSNNKNFDVESTQAIRGEWSTSLELLEYFRGSAGVVRSVEPNYSVCGMGPEADRLLKDLPNASFGPDCMYERLMTVRSKDLRNRRPPGGYAVPSLCRRRYRRSLSLQETFHRQYHAQWSCKQEGMDFNCPHPCSQRSP